LPSFETLASLTPQDEAEFFDRPFRGRRHTAPKSRTSNIRNCSKPQRPVRQQGVNRGALDPKRVYPFSNRFALSILANQVVRNGVIELNLPNGIYAVDVPDHGLRTGFELTGGIVTKLAAG
jgi:hypothetical protein